jgi:hypothetical protein
MHIDEGTNNFFKIKSIAYSPAQNQFKFVAIVHLTKMVKVLFLLLSLFLLLKLLQLVVCKVRMLAICLIECQAGIHL